MKRLKIFILLFFLLVLLSCAERKLYDYSLDDTPIVINLDSIELVTLKVGNVRYIPLETSDECLIGTAYKVLIKYVVGRNSNFLLYNKGTQIAYKLFSPYFEVVGCSDITGSTGKNFFGVINFNSENSAHKKILESNEELKNFKEDDNPVIAIFDLDMQSPEPFKF